MSEKQDSIKELATRIVSSPAILDRMLKELDGPSRRSRQNAAAVISQVSQLSPELLVEHVEELSDALTQPEAQTRWETLDALTNLVSLKPEECAACLQSAEDALFDEDNGLVRLAGFRFVCQLGSANQERAKQVWPLLDEAIQCYHGDFEYPDMLASLLSYAESDLDDSVKDALKGRVLFDSEHGHGGLKRRCQQIVEALS